MDLTVSGIAELVVLGCFAVGCLGYFGVRIVVFGFDIRRVLFGEIGNLGSFCFVIGFECLVGFGTLVYFLAARFWFGWLGVSACGLMIW